MFVVLIFSLFLSSCLPVSVLACDNKSEKFQIQIYDGNEIIVFSSDTSSIDHGLTSNNRSLPVFQAIKNYAEQAIKGHTEYESCLSSFDPNSPKLGKTFFNGFTSLIHEHELKRELEEIVK